MKKFDRVKVALDFDETYTLRPSLWSKIVQMMKAEDWDVKFVTFRHELSPGNEDIERESKALDIPIIYCNYYQKRHMVNREGWLPDIWIDDMPELIPTKSQLETMLRGVNRSDYQDEG